MTVKLKGKRLRINGQSLKVLYQVKGQRVMVKH